MFTHQLKRLLQKKAIHKFVWDPLPMYNPRKLVHSNREVDHFTYLEKRDPHWENNIHYVPDQKFLKVPVPNEYKDAYWWRDLQARRVQCPIDWVSHRMYRGTSRRATDFQDLAFRPKHRFTVMETVQHAKASRS